MSPKKADSMEMSEIYRFGPFALDAGAGMLFDGSEPTLLGQRGVALLRLLLERAPDRLSARTR